MKIPMTTDTFDVIVQDNSMLCDGLTLIKEAIFQEVPKEDIIELIDQTITEHNRTVTRIKTIQYYNTLLNQTSKFSSKVQ